MEQRPTGRSTKADRRSPDGANTQRPERRHSRISRKPREGSKGKETGRAGTAGGSRGVTSVPAAMGSRHRPQPKPGNNIVFRFLTAAEGLFGGGNEGGKNQVSRPAPVWRPGAAGFHPASLPLFIRRRSKARRRLRVHRGLLSRNRDGVPSS